MRYRLTPAGKIVLADEQGRPRQLANLTQLIVLANLTLDARDAAKARREDQPISFAGPI